MFLVASAGGRDLQYFLGPAAFDVRTRKEAGEVAADDFLRAVSGDSLGAGVPGDHLAARVQHEDRVVIDLVEERPILILAHAQRIFRQAAPAAVENDARARCDR